MVDRSRLPSLGPVPELRFPSIVQRPLANGLELRTVEHRSAPVVSLSLLVRGGLGADPPDREGLAALTADLVDEGTGPLSAIEVSDVLARLGADYDVDVGADAIVFSLATLSKFVDRGAALLAAITTRPALRENDFARVRQQRLDRLMQMRKVPQALAEASFDRLLYGSHPYGHLAIGTTDGLQASSLEDVRRFHAATFSPSGAVLVMVGALSHHEMQAVAEQAFGEWAAGGLVDPVQAAAAVAPMATPDGRCAYVSRPGAAQSELRIGHLAARRSTPDYFALLVMNAVLGGQFVSRLNLKLREEKGITYGVSTGFDWRRGLSPFSFEASVHTAATAEAIADVWREIGDIRGARPPSAEEMELALAALTRGYARGFETAAQVSRSVVALALHELPSDYFERFVSRVSAVTSADVVTAAERYLDPSRLTTLVVGDVDTIGPSLDTLGPAEWLALPTTL